MTLPARKIIFFLILQIALAGHAFAQTATYHLHKDPSSSTGLLQLKTANPDAAAFAVQSITNLKNQPAGEYLVKGFDTQSGVPNAAGVIPAGSTITFTLWMNKTSSSGTIYPRAKLQVNSAGGTLIATATGSTALTSTLTKYTLTAMTSSNISIASTDRFYLWVGVNVTTAPTTNTYGVVQVEGTAGGNYDSTIQVPLPVPPPAVSSLSPISGPVGAIVTVTGTNFGASQGTGTITFNGVAATPSSWGDTSITAPVPLGSTTGPVVITARGAASNATTFTVTPKIDSLSPATGPPGTSVTITGSSFGASQGGSTITFNGLAATPTSWGASTVTAPVPAGASSGSVVVTVASMQSNGAQFTVVNKGSIGGRVTGPNGTTVIPGAQVRVFQNSSQVATVTTNATGDYTLSNLDAGSYGVEASSFGYSPQSKSATVSASATSTINFALNNSGPVRYVYDELGRLSGVVDSAGDTAIYSYDSVGNLLSISRQSSVQPSIIEFTPNGGAVGTSVTIYGTAFSTTAGQNTVTFNGTAATVTSATATQLVTSVPAGAATGPIVVTTPSGTATSSTPFTVGSSSTGMPTISGFTPNIGAPGAALTVTGTNFDPTVSNNKLKVNSLLAGIGSAAPTSIVSTIPTVGSGRVSVNTPAGTAVSSADLFIPRSPYTAADVGYAGRMSVGTTQTVTISTLNKVGMMLFDGTQGQRVSFRFGPTNMNQVAFWIYDPTGVPIHRFANFNPSEGIYLPAGISEKFVDTISLPYTGTYMIFVTPTNSTGNLPITIYDVPTDVTSSITIGGPSVDVPTTAPGQNGKLFFDGTAGQKVSLTAGGTAGASVQIYNPYNGAFGPGGAVGFIDQLTLPYTGRYSISVDPGGASTGTTNITLHNANDVTGTITPGTPVTQTISSPGQNIRLSFGGTAGQRVSLNVTGTSSPSVYILKPDGTSLGSVNYQTGGQGYFIDTRTLPVDGTYTVFIDAYGADTGGVTIALQDVPADVAGTIGIGGPSVPLTIGTPGQNASFTFSGSAGQKVSLGLSGVTVGGTTIGSQVYIKKPDGTTLTSTELYPPGKTLDTLVLPVNGTYSIFVDPLGISTGNITLTLNNASDVAATITPNGSPVAATMSIPGQNAVLSFDGTTGQRVSLKLSSYGIAYWVSVRRPNGTDIFSPRFINSGFTGDFIDPITLDTTGTYTILIDPYDTFTGTVTSTLYDVPADTSGTVVVGGSAVTATTTSPGQNSSLTFEGTAGQQVTVRVTNNTITGVIIKLLNSSGGVQTYLETYNSSFNLTTVTLPATDTYRISIDPMGAFTGSISVSVTNP